jgi:hypothetical protein
MAYEGPHPFPVLSGGTGDSSFTPYSVICGGTASTAALQNVVGIGTSGQILTSNGAAALPTWQPSSSAGNFVLLSSQTASTTASIAFSSTFITNAYAINAVIFHDVIPVVDGASLHLTYSTNNGSSYLATNYVSATWGINYSATTWANMNTTTYVIVSVGISNSAGYGLSGIIYLFDLATGNTPTSHGTAMKPPVGTAVPNASLFSSAQTTTLINNIKFAFDTGNISSGVISLYGITG